MRKNSLHQIRVTSGKLPATKRLNCRAKLSRVEACKIERLSRDLTDIELGLFVHLLSSKELENSAVIWHQPKLNPELSDALTNIRCAYNMASADRKIKDNKEFCLYVASELASDAKYTQDVLFITLTRITRDRALRLSGIIKSMQLNHYRMIYSPDYLVDRLRDMA